MKKNTLSSQIGFSLTEIVVAMGIAVFSLFIMSSSFIYMYKESQKFTDKIFNEIENRLVERVLFRDLKNANSSFNILEINKNTFFNIPDSSSASKKIILSSTDQTDTETTNEIIFILSKNRKIPYSPAYAYETDFKSFKFKSLNYNCILSKENSTQCNSKFSPYLGLGSKEIWQTNNLIMLENPYFSSHEPSYSFFIGFVQEKDKNNEEQSLFPLKGNNCLSESYFNKTSHFKENENSFLQTIQSNNAPADIQASLLLIDIVKYFFKKSKTSDKWELYRSILKFDSNSKKCSFESEFFLCNTCKQIEFIRENSMEPTIKFKIISN